MEFLVTIDTEPDCDTAWRRSSPLAFTSIIRGIPELLRPIWDRHGIRPVYFVSPEVVRDDASCRALGDEIKRGAIIGAHLHSEYIGPDITIADPAGTASAEFPCFAHNAAIESAKIKNLTDLIVERLGVRPLWYRAARYGADLDTMKSLAALGYRYDSSVTPGINWSAIGGPDHRRAPLQPYWISPNDYYASVEQHRSLGVREYPITITGKRLGALGKLLPNSWLFYQWLRPTHMSVFEQKRMIKKLRNRFAEPVLVLMFHSMEIMIGATPFVRNAWMQRRFLKNLDRVCAYACKNSG